MGFWFAFAAALVLTPLLAAFGSRRGWIDHREGQEDRKPRTAPVATVGGAAILLSLGLALFLESRDVLAWDGPHWAWPALLGAVTLGLLDDSQPGGLTAAQKLCGQLVVAGLFGAASGLEEQSPWLAGLLALVAMNAVNTFDNADGAAGGLGLVGLGLTPGGGACAGFLPWNLWRRSNGVPTAYLGDAGSHLLGVLIAATPGAIGVLLLPVLDAARLIPVRLAAGSRPWIGDRRHLAHRLGAAGLGTRSVAGILALLAGLPVWGMALGGLNGAFAGAGLTTLGFCVAIGFTSDPCPAPEGSR